MTAVGDSVRLVSQVRETQASWKGRPVDLEVLARELGVIGIQEKPISVEAMSMRLPRGFRITLNSRTYPPSRRKFSLAHELGHIYMIQNGGVPVGPIGHDNKQVERRCDELASEFLMPYELFCEDISLKPVGLRSALELADTYLTSATTAAIRYVKLSDSPYVLVRWDRARGGTCTLRVRWQIHGKLSGPRAESRWTPGQGRSSPFVGAQRALESRDVCESTERIFVRSSAQPHAYMVSRDCRIESKGFGKKQGRFVLSLIHL